MDNTHPTHPLLVPRYQMIASYPGAKTEVFDILYKHIWPGTKNYSYLTNPESPLSGASLRHFEVEPYGHLFKRLSWWEERRKEEMPKYVRYAETGEVREVDHFDMESTSAWFMYLKGEVHPFCPGGSALENTHWQPATEQEYHTYLQSQSNRQ